MNKVGNINVPVLLVTWALFTVEASIHYTIGANKGSDEKKIFVLPPPKDILKIVSVVAVFSLLSAAIVPMVSKT